MLWELSILNYALIDNVHLRFGPGLNVLTGETGAGKSILIDAVELILGGRADAGVVRGGTSRAVVEITFDISRLPRVKDTLAELGFAEEDENLLVLTREVYAQGRSVARINARPATTAAMRAVTALLVDLYGQYEHQSLRSPLARLRLVDSYGGAPVTTLAAEFAKVYQQWSEIKKKRQSLLGDEHDRARRQDILRFQLDEIAAAALRPGEDEALAQERDVLANAERLYAAAARAYDLIRGGDQGRRTVLEMLAEVRTELEHAGRFDPALTPMREAVTSAYYALEEAARDLYRYRDSIPQDPGRLEAVQERLALISMLKRKYGDTIEQVLAWAERAAAELRAMEDTTGLVAELDRAEAEATARLAALGRELSGKRTAAARQLEGRVQEELRLLGMPEARFVVQVTQDTAPEGLVVDGATYHATPQGLDQVEFLFSANPGEEPLPLEKVASGGELSRVMLALKAVQAEADWTPTLIFDEIDAGIGGRTAATVAARLKKVAASHQVLCVTHLAQIAAAGDEHFVVEKVVEDGHTFTRVTELQGEARVLELARMLSGTQDEAAVRHARTMLSQVDQNI